MRSRWTGPEALAPRQLPNEACYTSERHDNGFLCDCFNLGIGRTSNSMHWRNDQHSELHDDGSASGTHSLESAHHGAAVKGASVQRTS
jgi:hypothetical protein